MTRPIDPACVYTLAVYCARTGRPIAIWRCLPGAWVHAVSRAAHNSWAEMDAIADPAFAKWRKAITGEIVGTLDSAEGPGRAPWLVLVEWMHERGVLDQELEPGRNEE